MSVQQTTGAAASSLTAVTMLVASAAPVATDSQETEKTAPVS